jgi:hypothetical protein
LWGELELLSSRSGVAAVAHVLFAHGANQVPAWAHPVSRCVCISLAFRHTRSPLSRRHR